MHKAIPRARLWELVAWLVRRRFRATVSGSSMTPTLHDGDTVLVRRYLDGAPQHGHVVLLMHPTKPIRIIKRLDHIRDGGALWLLGDNPNASTDSRTFGAVSGSQLMGSVTSRLGGPSR